MANYYHKNDLPKDIALKGDLAVDTEAMGLNNLRDRLCVVQLSTGNGDAHIVHFPKKEYKCPNLKAALSQKGAEYIFHFARFDVAIIHHYLGIEFQNVYCTKIASRLTRTYTEQHGLKDLCFEMAGGVKISKQQQSSNWGAATLSADQVNYAANDVLYLHAIRENLNKMLQSANRAELAKKCMDFVPTRAKLDLMGWENIDIFHH